MNYIDILILIIIALGAFKGYRRGLIVTLGGLAGYAASLVVAVMYAPALGKALTDRFHWTDRVALFLQDKLPIPQAVSSIRLNGESGAVTNDVISSMGLPAPLMERLQQMLSTGEYSTVGQALTHLLANYLIQGVAFLLLACAAALIIRALVRMVAGGLRRSFLGTVDRFGGFVLGIITPVLSLSIMLGLIMPMIAVSSRLPGTTAVGFLQQLNNSMLVLYLQQVFHLLSSRMLAAL
ncbi:MAG: CvpA family protein [Bacillota bacterium]